MLCLVSSLAGSNSKSLKGMCRKQPCQRGGVKCSADSQEVERVRWEEQRKSMQQDAQTKAELSKYDDQLARARAADEHEKYRQRNAELVRMQEESSARQEQQRQVVAQQIEAERRATDQHKARLFDFRANQLEGCVEQPLAYRCSPFSLPL